MAALRRGELAVVTLAARSRSRWTQGAGTCKALHPFCKIQGRHRTFIEVHLAKSARAAALGLPPLPHVFTTSYHTHQPTEAFIARTLQGSYPGLLLLSPGRSVGLRLIPTKRDLRFHWQETAQQLLDEQQQKLPGQPAPSPAPMGRGLRRQGLHRQRSSPMPPSRRPLL